MKQKTTLCSNGRRIGEENKKCAENHFQKYCTNQTMVTMGEMGITVVEIRCTCEVVSTTTGWKIQHKKATIQS